jgi:LPS export ABC transporter protein LptC
MRYILWIIITILTIFLVWNPFHYDEDDKGFWTPELTNMKADLLLRDIRYRRESNGRVQWRIDASTARMFETKKMILFEKPDMVFFNNDAGNITITAQSGEYRIPDDAVTLYGDVTIKTADNSTLHTDFLRFLQEEMLIDTDRNVTIIKKDYLSINGTGLRYDIKRNLVEIRNPTTLIP